MTFLGAIAGRALRAVTLSLLLLGCSGCAATLGFPTSGSVKDLGDSKTDDRQIVVKPRLPIADADPESIVSGFLSAQPNGLRTGDFTVARAFLTNRAAERWQMGSTSRIYAGYPSISRRADFIGVSSGGNGRVTVIVRLNERGTLDGHGVYSTENREGRTTFEYTLVSVAGQWRISSLPPGTMIAEADFAQSFRGVNIYRLSSSRRTFVPDTRWFGWKQWRRRAVEELLLAPPRWLRGAVMSVNAEPGIRLLSLTGGDGNPVVQLSGQLSELGSQERAVLIRQIRLTLGDGASSTILSGVWAGGKNYSRADGDLDIGVNQPATSIYVLRANSNVSVLTPNLLQVGQTVDSSNAAGFAFSRYGGAILHRNGAAQYINAHAASCGSAFSGHAVSTVGSGIGGELWAGSGDRLLISDRHHERTLTAPWLHDGRIMAVTLSPEGSRLVIVMKDSRGEHVVMTGVMRNRDGSAIALSDAMIRLSAVSDVASVAFYNDTTLVYVASDANVGGGYQQTLPGPEERQNIPLGTTALASGQIGGVQSIVALDGSGVAHALVGSLSGAWVYVDTQTVAVSSGDSPSN